MQNNATTYTETLNPAAREAKWSQYGSNRTEQRQNMPSMSADDRLNFVCDGQVRCGGIIDFTYFNRPEDDGLIKKIRSCFTDVADSFRKIVIEKDHSDPTVDAFTVTTTSDAQPETVERYLKSVVAGKLGGRKQYIVTVDIIKAEGNTVIAHFSF